MNDIPETRVSLLVRIRDAADHQSWEEFSAIYRPIIYRMARRRGLQDADAQDLTQQVLTSVAAHIHDWKPDVQRARFRTWLARVTRNAIIDSCRRIHPDQATGGSDAMLQIHETTDDELETEIDREYRRQLFRRAAEQIENEFEPATWNCFWQSTVEGCSIAQVVERTGKSKGSVYTARSRVMKRLKECVSELDTRSD